MSTLPKSLQAQQESSSGNLVDDDRSRTIQDFVEKLGQMPDNFLRIPPDCYPQDFTVATQPRAIVTSRDAPLVDMIDISVVEAQLVKNYGLLKMDLYCKIRVGHMVCETQTCLNGAKNPKWDGVYQFSMKPGIDSFHLEIYDEKQFSLDEKIAWLHEPIPPEIFQGITIERWFPLSGRSGNAKEGSILLVLSHKRMPLRASNLERVAATNSSAAPLVGVFVPSTNHGPVVTGPTVLPVDPRGPTINPQTGQVTTAHQLGAGVIEMRPASEEDINQLSEMFPSIDKAVIKAILENNSNDKEAAIGALLALS